MSLVSIKMFKYLKFIFVYISNSNNLVFICATINIILKSAIIIIKKMNLYKLAKINLFLIISYLKLSNLMADKLTGKLLLFGYLHYSIQIYLYILNLLKGNNFYKIEKKNLDEISKKISLIKSFNVNNHFECMLECSKNFLCSLVIVDSLNCNIVNQIQLTASNMIYSPTSTIYVKNDSNQYNQYLIHYWPFNGNYNDVISNANLFNGKNNSLISDRFNRTNSSLYLNYGYLQVPNGYYIYGDFTLTIWVKMYTLEPGRTKTKTRFCLV